MNESALNVIRVKRMWNTFSVRFSRSAASAIVAISLALYTLLHMLLTRKGAHITSSQSGLQLFLLFYSTLLSDWLRASNFNRNEFAFDEVNERSKSLLRIIIANRLFSQHQDENYVIITLYIYIYSARSVFFSRNNVFSPGWHDLRGYTLWWVKKSKKILWLIFNEHTFKSLCSKF